MKKQYIFLGIVLLLVGTIVTLSIYKYNSQKHLTTAQAISQRDTALTDLYIQKQLNVGDQRTIDNLLKDKTDLCLQIKAAKLVQPVCQ